jgi:hypothetical protein
MLSLRKEFQSILASCLDFIFENARPEARPAFRALPRDAAPDALDPVPFNSLDFSEGLTDPDAQSFGNVLEEELQHTLEDQLGRNLLHSIIGAAQEQIRDQSRSCGYDEREISVVFRLWQQEETRAPLFDDPDRYWRTLYGWVWFVGSRCTSIHKTGTQ